VGVNVTSMSDVSSASLPVVWRVTARSLAAAGTVSAIAVAPGTEAVVFSEPASAALAPTATRKPANAERQRLDDRVSARTTDARANAEARDGRMSEVSWLGVVQRSRAQRSSGSGPKGVGPARRQPVVRTVGDLTTR
jgi:hypothetical protein